jgi:hypothetical protein
MYPSIYYCISEKDRILISISHHPLHSPLGSEPAKQIAWVLHHDSLTVRRVFVDFRFGDGLSGFYHLKGLLFEIVHIFLQGFYPSLHSQIEIKRCRCRHGRVAQERIEAIRKVISIFLQISSDSPDTTISSSLIRPLQFGAQLVSEGWPLLPIRAVLITLITLMTLIYFHLITV